MSEVDASRHCVEVLVPEGIAEAWGKVAEASWSRLGGELCAPVWMVGQRMLWLCLARARIAACMQRPMQQFSTFVLVAIALSYSVAARSLLLHISISDSHAHLQSLKRPNNLPVGGKIVRTRGIKVQAASSLFLCFGGPFYRCCCCTSSVLSIASFDFGMLPRALMLGSNPFRCLFVL